MSVRSTFAVFVATAISLVTPSVHADSLLQRYPHDQRVTLSDGQTMWLPLHIQKGQGVVLVGFADLDRLTEYLAPEGLKPIAITPKQGLIALYNMNYQRTDIGAYRELVISVAATRDKRPRAPLLSALNDYAGLLSIYVPFLRGLVSDRTQDVLFTWKLYVTEELPMRAGLDVWGFPKSIGDIDVSVSDRGASFYVEDQGELVLYGSYSRLLPWHVPVSIDAFLATPVGVKPTLTNGLADTQSRFGLFLPWDHFELNPYHPWGAALDDVKFRPAIWHTMSELESVFLKPVAR
jgi:hypothetical protein